MKETAVNGEMVSTAMFEGSFFLAGGARTYEGRFLGINYETMLAKLAGLGMAIDGEIVDVGFYGISGANITGRNDEYFTDPGNPRFFGRVDFFCMFDGKTFSDVTAVTPVGLTVFINRNGSRWVTYNVNTINFITG
jgi:hypothetical protein